MQSRWLGTNCTILENTVLVSFHTLYICNDAGELVPGDDEAARGGPGAQRPGGQLLQPEPGGGGTAGLRHLLLQGWEHPPEGGLRHTSNIRLAEEAHVRIETPSKCSNWDPKQMFELRPKANVRIKTQSKYSNGDPKQMFELRPKANVRIKTQKPLLKAGFLPPKRAKTRYDLTQRSLWSPCVRNV